MSSMTMSQRPSTTTAALVLRTRNLTHFAFFILHYSLIIQARLADLSCEIVQMSNDYLRMKNAK